MPELVESRDTARDGGRGADDTGIEPEINSDLKKKIEKINAIPPFKKYALTGGVHYAPHPKE